MFSLDLPSTISFQVPDWKGGIRNIAGYLQDAASTAYDSAKTYIDPAIKSAVSLEQNAATFLITEPIKAAETVFSATGDAAATAATKIGSTIKAGALAVFSPLASGLKTVVIIVGVGVAIYAFLLAAPFLPKPSR